MDLPKATSFVGLEKKPPPYEKYPYKKDVKYLCPVCNGYGGWNIRLDAYGPGKHFDAHCSQCNGWGWVNEADLCIHDMREMSQEECKEKGIYHYGIFNHIYECRVCGHRHNYDSSG